MTLIAQRPVPGPPRPFRFPGFTRERLDNGLTVIACHLPGRPLVTANLILEAGAENEAAAEGGVASLAARALTEGTASLDAAAFADAVERVGAELTAAAGWDSFRVGVNVPVARLRDALALVADAVRNPAFPASEVDRLREERLNQIKQQRAHSGMRALLAFPEAVFTSDTPYARPTAGNEPTVATLTRDHVERFYTTYATPGSATLILAGDLDASPAGELAASLFGDWSAPEPTRAAPRIGERAADNAITVIDRPGSVQSDLVVGHAAGPRTAADHHLVELIEEVLGGLFNSRLNMLLREEKGYTYGVRGSLDTRRRGGTLFTWVPVQAPTTAESLADIVDGFRAMHDGGMTQAELDDARDYLVGVFPLRNETPEQIAGLIGQIVVYGLPDDQYDRERAAMEAATVDQVAEAARANLHPDALSLVVVGDAEQIAQPLRETGVGPVTVVSD